MAVSLPRSALGFNEAPAILPGKAVLEQLGTGVPRIASMRPRRFCRGKSETTRPAARGTGRFNEAPAILPGKGARPGSRRRRRSCFNEAPAILPGKDR